MEVSAEGGGATVAELGTSTERVTSELVMTMALIAASLVSRPTLVCKGAVPVAGTDVFEERGGCGN